MTRITHSARVLLIACILAVTWVVEAAASRPELSLSPEEHAWLAQHPVIRVGYDPSFPPFCFRDSRGLPHGIDADLLDELSLELGVRFELHSAATWTEVYDAAKRREVDVLSSTADLPERRPFFLFTQPYVQFAVTIVTRTDGPFAVTESDLKTMRVAAVRNYAPTLAFLAGYPGVRVIEFNSIDAALRAVANSDADAVVTNLANASYVIKTRGLLNLKIAGVIPEVFQERLAVRRDWPELAAILDRALATLPPETMATILNRWVKVDYAAVIRWDLVRRWMLFAGVLMLTVIGLVLWRSVSMGHELAKRREVLVELERANARLNAANRELARRHDEMAELMRVAAHDLRGPLSAILLGAEAIRDEVEPVVVDSILGSARRMAQLVDNLLQVHALEEGERKLRRETVKPDEIVRAAVATYQGTAIRKQITIDASGLGPLGEVCGDPVALQQVFENLISNALKFSPPLTSVRISSVQTEDFVRIQIRDEGPGVSADERERIFAKYARGSARPTGDEQSIGLGLAIVREIIAASNGRVWCEAASGAGAVFVVALPRPVPADQLAPARGAA